jgi:preprotein translocase subunit SecG
VLLTLLVVVHVIVAIFLIAVVLLQTGKAGNIADVFGGGGSMAAFGARGAATVLSRVTWVAAFLFLVTSLTLSLMKTGSSSIMRGRPNSPTQQKQSAPPAPQKAPAQQSPQSR